MSDLEQQASAWVPPWQRPGAPVANPTEDSSPSSDVDRALSDDDTPSGDTSSTVDDALEVEEAPAAEPQAADSDADAPADVENAEPSAAEGAALKGTAKKSKRSAGEGKEGQRQAVVGVLTAALPGQRAPGEDEETGEAEAAAPLVELSEAELVSALEAILMVVDEPVSEISLASVLEVPAEQVANALIDMSAGYTRESRGFDLRRAAGGWRFYTRADYSSYVERYVLDGQQLRLTQASLETLAVVAYKQPVTRSRISAIRGVNCDGVIRTLITRGMVEECGTDPDSGAHLYRTTTLFLEKMGLDTVEQLPALAPFLPDNLEELAAGE